MGSPSIESILAPGRRCVLFWQATSASADGQDGVVLRGTRQRKLRSRRSVQVGHAETPIGRGVGLLDESDRSVRQHLNRLAERAGGPVVDAGQEVIVAVAEQLRAAQGEGVDPQAG